MRSSGGEKCYFFGKFCVHGKWIIPIVNKSLGVVGSLQSPLTVSSVVPVGSTV